jgi:hypothetical protein
VFADAVAESDGFKTVLALAFDVGRVVFAVDVFADGGDAEDGLHRRGGGADQAEVELQRLGDRKRLLEGQSFLGMLGKDVLRFYGPCCHLTHLGFLLVVLLSYRLSLCLAGFACFLSNRQFMLYLLDAVDDAGDLAIDIDFPIDERRLHGSTLTLMFMNSAISRK